MRVLGRAMEGEARRLGRRGQATAALRPPPNFASPAPPDTRTPPGRCTHTAQHTTVLTSCAGALPPSEAAAMEAAQPRLLPSPLPHHSAAPGARRPGGGAGRARERAYPSRGRAWLTFVSVGAGARERRKVARGVFFFFCSRSPPNEEKNSHRRKKGALFWCNTLFWICTRRRRVWPEVKKNGGAGGF